MRPTDFASQLNVSIANGWGIVRTITDLCMKMPEGKYVLVKDPNRVMWSYSATHTMLTFSSLVCDTTVLRTHDDLCDRRRGW